MAIISAVIGLAAPFLPDVIGIGRSFLEDRQERKMMELRLKYAEKDHDWKMDEIEIKETLKDVASARKHDKKPGFGIQLLQAAHEAKGVLSKWIFNIVFILYTIVDLFSSFVRPFVTYALVGLYMAIKIAMIYSLYLAYGDFTAALIYDGVWTSFDKELLIMIVGFWFGTRVRHKAKATVE